MSSLINIYEKYKLGCDKGRVHSYIETYDTILANYVNSKTVLLEIGVASGCSLKMWEDYLGNGVIHGIDLSPKPTILNESPNIVYHQFDGSNIELLHKTFHDIKFDIIIDDGSHALNQQMLSLCALYGKLNYGGLYIIEDIQKIEFVEYFKFLPDMRVVDLRDVKNRYDDIMVIYKKFNYRS